MTLGVSILGDIPFGDTEPLIPPAVSGTRTAGTPVSGADNGVFGRGLGFLALPGLPDTPPDLAIPSPVLQFFEIVTSTATVRVVDFADPEASGTPGQVTFNGSEWTSLKLGKPTIEEGLDGRSPSLTLQVADPRRTIAQFVRANNKLRGAVVNLYLIEWRYLSQPALAKTYRFLVQRTQCIEGPPRVAVTFASPSLHDLGYPKIPISRLVCQNPFHRRFIYDGRNLCQYPSDEFAYQTQQVLTDDVDTEIEKQHGWFVVNGSKPGLWAVARDTPFINVPKMVITSEATVGDPEAWINASRAGAYMYKIIEDSAASDADIDVATLVDISGGTPDNISGILVQSVSSPSEWIFWASRAVSGSFDLLSRVTSSDVSTDTAVAQVDNALRVERTGSTWKLYSQNVLLNKTVLSAGWTLRRTETLAMTGDVRVGLAFSGIALEAPHSIDTFAYWFRFAKGGFATCDKSLTDCTERKNTVQRNAFLSLPDSVRTF